MDKLTNSATTQEIIDKINEIVDAINKDLWGIINN